LLEKPEPLVDRLWRHEVAVEPLGTPEAKARLKQRLLGHAKTIGHESLASQYRQEFFERLDTALRRPERPRGKAGKGRFYEPERPLTQTTRTISDTGIEPLYARAILAGLIRHPTMLLACAEALSQLPIPDGELAGLRDCMLDTAFDQHDLDSAQLVTICAEAGFGRLADQLINAKSLAFSFMRRQADPETARRDLGMVIEALAARPELDAALAAATARLRESLDDAGLAEQQRLMMARHEVEQRLAALVQPDDGSE
jgi:DNA primase